MEHHPESWVCIQLGARQHYVLPRAFHSLGVLSYLITDLWTRPDSTRARLFPRLKGRFHPELPLAKVGHGDLGWLAKELWLRFRYRLADNEDWSVICARNAAFDRLAQRRLRECFGGKAVPPRVFSYAYGCPNTFVKAADKGCRPVLGQIDGGPLEEEIFLAESRRYPELKERYRPAPEEYWKDWERQWQSASRIVVNSTWTEECITGAGVPKEKISIVPLYFQPDRSPPVQREPSPRFDRSRPLKALFLGQFNLRKGAARVLEAARKLKDEPVELQIVGPSMIDIPEDVLALRNFRFVGPVARSSASSYYRDADVFLLPTLSDGFAITQLEAQSYGLPLIVSRRCGSVVNHLENGIVLPEVTGEAIAESLLSLLRNPAQLGAMSAKSKTTFTSLDDYGRSVLAAADKRPEIRLAATSTP
jgi:glycosyltransferase involved in cell wall biosynthesis